MSAALLVFTDVRGRGGPPQVYVRNHGAPHTVGLDDDGGDAAQGRATKSHTLVELVEDFDRIAAMGFDYVYLLPIHPPGKLYKKGSMGCPYSIRDYTDVDPKLGNIGDFEQLVYSAAERGLGVVMDIVYNHTAHDSVIANELPMCVACARPRPTQPPWPPPSSHGHAACAASVRTTAAASCWLARGQCRRRSNVRRVNGMFDRVLCRRWMRRQRSGLAYCSEADWTDVADLWHDNPDGESRNAMWEFLIEQMLFWVKKGVAGFRCVRASAARCTSVVLLRSTKKRGRLWASRAELSECVCVCVQLRRGVASSSSVLGAGHQQGEENEPGRVIHRRVHHNRPRGVATPAQPYGGARRRPVRLRLRLLVRLRLVGHVD